MARLVDAYSRGIFPWSTAEDPLLWWSPDPRMVLFLNELHVSKSLARGLRSGRLLVTLDMAFGDVIDRCAEPLHDQGGTWITPDMRSAYLELARLGRAHSVEVTLDGALVGGLYGVALGRMFFGESMFSRRRDASKMALVQLVRQLRRWRFELMDCQMSTEHLASLGAREVSRNRFLAAVTRLVQKPEVTAPWRFDADLYNGDAS